MHKKLFLSLALTLCLCLVFSTSSFAASALYNPDRYTDWYLQVDCSKSGPPAASKAEGYSIATSKWTTGAYKSIQEMELNAELWIYSTDWRLADSEYQKKSNVFMLNSYLESNVTAMTQAKNTTTATFKDGTATWSKTLVQN